MKKYYYIGAQNTQKGPYTLEEMRGEGITPQTLVWYEGMSDWKPAGETEELRCLFASVPPVSGTYQSTPGYAPQQPGIPVPPAGATFNQAGGSTPPQTRPDSWLVWSILSTILCCLPLGIVAIIYATKVDKLWDMHDYAGAVKAAQQAKTFTLIGAGVGLLGGIIYFILIMVGALAGGF